jgi:multisubunit Na+/H+ antiporter MnhE subunit
VEERRRRSTSREFSIIARGRPRALETPLERAAFFATWWVLSFVLWSLLVFKTELAEFVAGAVAATFAATAAEVVRAKGYAPFGPDLRWGMKLLRLPWEVVRDSFLLFRELARAARRRKPIEGGFRCIHFPNADRTDPRGQARLTVAKWLGGVSPNTMVVGFDEPGDTALVHQVVRSRRPPDVDPGQ